MTFPLYSHNHYCLAQAGMLRCKEKEIVSVQLLTFKINSLKLLSESRDMNAKAISLSFFFFVFERIFFSLEGKHFF